MPFNFYKHISLKIYYFFYKLISIWYWHKLIKKQYSSLSIFLYKIFVYVVYQKQNLLRNFIEVVIYKFQDLVIPWIWRCVYYFNSTTNIIKKINILKTMIITLQSSKPYCYTHFPNIHCHKSRCFYIYFFCQSRLSEFVAWYAQLKDAWLHKLKTPLETFNWLNSTRTWSLIFHFIRLTSRKDDKDRETIQSSNLR
jgi:hypothetical protein